MIHDQNIATRLTATTCFPWYMICFITDLTIFFRDVEAHPLSCPEMCRRILSNQSWMNILPGQKNSYPNSSFVSWCSFTSIMYLLWADGTNKQLLPFLHHASYWKHNFSRFTFHADLSRVPEISLIKLILENNYFQKFKHELLWSLMILNIQPCSLVLVEEQQMSSMTMLDFLFLFFFFDEKKGI